MRRDTLIILMSIIVSGAVFAYVLRDVPLQEVAESIRQASIGWVIVCLLMNILSVWTRGIRWRIMLQNRLTVKDSLLIMGVTYLLNQLPLRFGEIARSFIAAQRGIPIMTAATSIVVERLIDTLLVVIFVAFSVAQLPDVPPSVTSGAQLFAILGVIGFAILLFFAYFPNIPRSILKWLMGILPILERLPLADFLEQVLDGLQLLKDFKTFSYVMLWTGIAWFTSIFGVYAAAKSLGVDENIWLVSIMGVSMAALSIAIPVSVASIGLIEGAFQVVGELVNLEIVTYTALGFMFHGMMVLGYVITGIIGILGLGLNMAELFKKRDDNSDVNQPAQI